MKTEQPVATTKAYLEKPVVTDVECLVSGMSRPDVMNLTSLHVLTEAVVLHDHVIYPLIVNPSDEASFPLYDVLRQKHIIDLELTLAWSGVSEAFHSEYIYGINGALEAAQNRESYPIFTSEELERIGYQELNDATLAHLKFWNYCFSKSEALGVNNADDLLRLLKKHESEHIRKNKKLASLIEHLRALSVMIIGNKSLADIFGAQIYTHALSEPFLIAETRKFTLTRGIYARLANLFNVSVERLLQHQGSQYMALPPLLALLLDGCRNKDEIPGRLVELRDDFTMLRKTLSHFESRINESSRLGDQLDALDELDDSWEAIIRKTKMRESRIIHKFWAVIREGSPLKIGRKVLDDLYEKDQESQILARMQGFANLWDKCMNINDYSGLVQRVFKRPVLTTRPLFREFMTLAEFTSKMHKL